jgi:dCTP deaminase
MTIKNDSWIVEMSRKGMIEPFAPEQVKTGISFGVSSYGYDFRIADEFKIFDPGVVNPGEVQKTFVDPKNFNAIHFREFKGDVCLIPANGYVLARTVEYFRIPRNILTIAFGKSTYARCGVYIHVTPFEPEWEGHATIAISNATPLPAKIYAGEGIGQLIFLEADDLCAVSYADKKGKYQAQKEITHAKI